MKCTNCKSDFMRARLYIGGLWLCSDCAYRARVRRDRTSTVAATEDDGAAAERNAIPATACCPA